MKKIPVDKLIEHAEAFGEGMKKGKELAIHNYDRMFLELFDKMQEIEDKLDSFISGLEKFTKKKSVKNTESVIDSPLSDTQDSYSVDNVPSQDKIEDIHSKNRELIDKDYDIDDAIIEEDIAKGRYAKTNSEEKR